MAIRAPDGAKNKIQTYANISLVLYILLIMGYWLISTEQILALSSYILPIFDIWKHM